MLAYTAPGQPAIGCARAATTDVSSKERTLQYLGSGDGGVISALLDQEREREREREGERVTL